MSIGSVMPSSHLILCRSLLLLSSVFPSIGVFSNESHLKAGKKERKLRTACGQRARGAFVDLPSSC